MFRGLLYFHHTLALGVVDAGEAGDGPFRNHSLKRRPSCYLLLVIGREANLIPLE